jgi:HemK-related putative methylase
MSEIYQPEEDSFLLLDVLKKQLKNKKIKILDMGSGSGIQAETFLTLGISKKNITLVDINKEAIKYLRKKFPNLKVIYSDLFEEISKKEKFDLIVFNPPYLPEDKEEPKDSRTATTGGFFGSEIINKFLSQAKDYLDKKGKIYLLISNLTQEINWHSWKKKLIAKKKLFMEELYVWELSQ